MDPDSGLFQQLEYGILPTVFADFPIAINSVTGKLTTNSSLNREEYSRYVICSICSLFNFQVCGLTAFCLVS